MAPLWAMSCKVFWMQNERGSGGLPVEWYVRHDQLLNWADRQPMQAICRGGSRALSGAT